ncbi:transposase [Streptomyces tendae]
MWARHCRWAADGTWDRVLGVLLARADDDGLIDWRVAADSTITRAHQHATNTRRPGKCRPQPEVRPSTPTESLPGTRSAVPAAG